MENELPNIWWLLDPAFIKMYCEDQHIEEDEDSLYAVKGDIETRLKNMGDLPSYVNGIASSLQVVSTENVIFYRQNLLRIVALSKHYDSNNLPQLNIVMTIPPNRTPLGYMGEIIKITQGVRQYIKPVITFVDFKQDLVTVEI